jgi:putative endonuclease
MAPARAWFVYLLECASGRIYTGATPDLARRLHAHRNGRGARFTRMDPPSRLLASQKFASHGEALQAEARVKRLTAAKKRELAQEWGGGEGSEGIDVSSF